MIRFAIFISFVFTCPVFGQSIQTESLAKQQQQDEPNEQQEGKSDNGFPITVYGPQEKLEIDSTDPPAALTTRFRYGFTNDQDEFIRTGSINGLLQMISRNGRILWTIPCRRFSGNGLEEIIADAQRQRIYIAEASDHVHNIASQISALDFTGNRLWTVDLLDFKDEGWCNSLKVDSKSGNLWVSRGDFETLVFDPQGRMIKSIPINSDVMAYDPKTNSFWMLGSDLFHVSSDFEILRGIKRETRRTPGAHCSIFIDSDGTLWKTTDPLQASGRLQQISSNGELLRDIKIQGANTLLIKPWGKEKFILLDGDSYKNHIIFDKQTGDISTPLDQVELPELRDFRNYAPLVLRSESAIWIHRKDGISAVDFNSQKLFSHEHLTVDDCKREREKRQRQADLLSKKFDETNPSFKRARKIVEDWSELIKGYGEAEKKSKKISRQFGLHIIR